MERKQKAYKAWQVASAFVVGAVLTGGLMMTSGVGTQGFIKVNSRNLSSVSEVKTLDSQKIDLISKNTEDVKVFKRVELKFRHSLDEMKNNNEVNELKINFKNKEDFDDMVKWLKDNKELDNVKVFTPGFDEEGQIKVWFNSVEDLKKIKVWFNDKEGFLDLKVCCI